MEDALALGDDEGRGKLRKTAGRCKRPIDPQDVRMGQPDYVEDIVDNSR